MKQEIKMIQCPGCRICQPDKHLDSPDRFNASGECMQLYYEITYYTLSKNDAGFIHQYVVDSYAAQHSGPMTRTITTAFALIGLFLAVERGYTGKMVQEAHMKIAKVRREWPRLDPPVQPAKLTVVDVLRADTNEEKDCMIRKWSLSVWESWSDHHEWVREITDQVLPK